MPKNNKISWRSVKCQHKGDIQHWIRDINLSVRCSDLSRSLIKAGCTTNQIYIALQDLGMNIYEEDIQVLIKREFGRKPYK